MEELKLPDYSTEKETLTLSERFRYHPPGNTQIPRYEEIRREGLRLAMIIEKDCPPSREKSLAQTHLQQAIQMANAAIAITEAISGRERPAEPGDPAPARV